jgi:RNA polymerase sigma-70 factor (ECF subfamily)
MSAHPRTLELQQFVEQHYRKVVGSVALITGDRQAAEDAVQEALLKAWRRRDEPVDRLAAWITVVASNDARSQHRRRGAEARALDKSQRAPQTAADDGGSGVLDVDLAQALAALPIRERQAAVLFYVDDRSVIDVAEALGVSEGTVKTLLSRARAHLAAALGDEAEGGVA